MSMQTKTIGRMPTDHGPYDPQLAYGKKFQCELFGCIWESLHDNNNTAPAVWDGGDIITPNLVDWKKASGSYEAWLMNKDKPATTGNTGDYPYNGMGRVRLQKNIVNGVNTLTQDMFYKGAVGSRVPNTNTIFVIQYDYVLGEDITVPANCVLEFDGGSINNNSNSLNFNGCQLQGLSKNVLNITPTGNVQNTSIPCSVFGINSSLVDAGIRLGLILNWAVKNEVEIDIDENLTIGTDIEIYPGEDNTTPKMGLKLISYNNSSITFVGNADNGITIIPNKTYTDNNYCFYYYGYIKNIIFYANTSSQMTSILNLSGCWYLQIENCLLYGNNKAKNGIYTETKQNNPDNTASVLRIIKCHISQCTVAAFNNEYQLGAPNLFVDRCIFDSCGTGMIYNSAGAIVVNSGITRNDIGLQLGTNSLSGGCRCNKFLTIEFDGNPTSILAGYSRCNSFEDCRMFATQGYSGDFYVLKFLNVDTQFINNSFTHCEFQNRGAGGNYIVTNNINGQKSLNNLYNYFVDNIIGIDTGDSESTFFDLVTTNNEVANFVNRTNQYKVREYKSFGETADRPELSTKLINTDTGFMYWDIDKKKPVFATSTGWYDADGIPDSTLRYGGVSGRPSLVATQRGFVYFDTDHWMPYFWSQNRGFVSASGFSAALTRGITAYRPKGTAATGGVLTSNDIGFCYFDTTISKPIYAKEIDSTTGNVTWVDATGATV